MGSSRSKRRGSGRNLIKFVALAVLAVVSLGVAGFALYGPKEAPPVSEQVATYKPTPYVPKVAQVAGFLGDSFAAGDGLADRAGRWTALLAAKKGWKEVNAGSGGTGYETGGNISGHVPYTARIADLVAQKPTVVVVSGGGNDMGQYHRDPASVQAAVKATYAQLRSALPDARIIGISSDPGTKMFDPAAAELDAFIAATVRGVGGEYVDLKRPLEGHPEWIQADGIHPNVAGHAALADLTAAAIPNKP